MVPHVESSDSDRSTHDSYNATESSDSEDYSEEDVEQKSTPDESEATCYVAPNGVKFWTPKCEESKKPQVNHHFPTIEDAFLFYKEYGRSCGFDVRKSSKKPYKRGTYAKHIQCSHGGGPGKKILNGFDDAVVEGSQRRTTSQRCYCKAKIVLKPAGVRGFVIMSFVEEHNHSFAYGPARMFLRCNRNLSVTHQNFIMDCARANIGATRAHSLMKEMTGSYDNVGATIADFKNFARDVKVRIGDHDADMILDKFSVLKKATENSFYYDYKVNRKGRLTGLFWTDAIGQANFDVFGDIISFDPTFRTNKYYFHSLFQYFLVYNKLTVLASYTPFNKYFKMIYLIHNILTFLLCYAKFFTLIFLRFMFLTC